MMSTSHVYDEPTNVGDVVWAKMNSFPFWPARIATMGEAYAENHKKKDNSVAFNSDLNQKYCNDKSKQGFVFVNFFGSFDYAWVRVSGNKGTKPFDQSDASRRLRKLKKSKPPKLYYKSYIRHENFRPLSVHPDFSVTLRVPPLNSETGWTGELWSKTNLLNWQN